MAVRAREMGKEQIGSDMVMVRETSYGAALAFGSDDAERDFHL